MSKFLLINDIHLSDRAPGSCTDTYNDDLFGLLEQAAEMARLHRCNGIVLAGDVFHHKTPSRTSHQTVMRLIDWARVLPIQVYAVVGNHDIQHDRVGSIAETQPLGVVAASGAIQILNGWDEHWPIYGVPWQMTWDQANVDLALAEYRRGALEEQATLVVTHAPLYPPGRELKFEFFPAADFAAAMTVPVSGPMAVHYGHVHEPHGVYEVAGVIFSNCGALSRGSLHEHNLNRMPSVAIWDSRTGEITHHELIAKPADEIFKLQEAHEAKQRALDLSSFLDAVQATTLDMSTLDAVLAHVRQTQKDPALIAVIDKLLAEAS